MNAPLLPSGLMDVLPPMAMQEFGLIHHLLTCFRRFGYQPVIPPLMEYEDVLLSGQGAATAHHVFRVMDPLAGRMLALRADMTSQITRIATHQLAGAPRPLRLCYAGYTLRTMPGALETRRQHMQVGIERYGSFASEALAEVIMIAVHALGTSGIGAMTVDIHYPSILAPLLESVVQKDAAIEAVKRKDIARLEMLGATQIAALVAASGEAEHVLPQLRAMEHPAILKAAEEVAALVQALKVRGVAAGVTLDLVDMSGYGYYTGLGFALFLNQPALELGRGGTYRTPAGEAAVGFTLYANDMLALLPPVKELPVKTLPAETPAEEAAELQAQGFITMLGE
jgi:ATP phosphoribosyltransferase regulatory subunit